MACASIHRTESAISGRGTDESEANPAAALIIMLLRTVAPVARVTDTPAPILLPDGLSGLALGGDEEERVEERGEPATGEVAVEITPADDAELIRAVSLFRSSTYDDLISFFFFFHLLTSKEGNVPQWKDAG